MDWLVQLIYGHSVASTVLVIGLVAALGLALGSLSCRGVSLGIAGVLFAGLAFGHWHDTVNRDVLEFLREFGLILFVYTIGMQVGPGFFASLRRHGLPLNLLALATVLLGVGVTLLLHFAGGIQIPAAVGLLAGATTNTPSLAAAQQALAEAHGVTEEARNLPALGYAIAYPFGVLGLILTLVLTRLTFRVDLRQEHDAFERLHQTAPLPVATMNIEVTNRCLDGCPLGEVPCLAGSGVVVSHILQKRLPELARPDTRVEVGDVLLAVGPPSQLGRFCACVGRENKTDIRFLPSRIVSRRFVVTRRPVLGRTLAELNLRQRFGVNVTRVQRGEVSFTPTGGFELLFGDVVYAVGEDENLSRMAAELGDLPRELDHPKVIPLFVGIVLGVVLGSLPLPIPGLPAPVRLGLAGGPLIVAILLGRLRHFGPLVWHLPAGASFMLREMGIVLFLACVGLLAGDRFLDTLLHGPGLYWLACATAITLVPVLLVAAFARLVLRLNYLTLCGLLAGSMTDPPALAFATSVSRSDAPSFAYATVYPLTMLLRLLAAQALVLAFL